MKKFIESAWNQHVLNVSEDPVYFVFSGIVFAMLVVFLTCILPAMLFVLIFPGVK